MVVQCKNDDAKLADAVIAEEASQVDEFAVFSISKLLLRLGCEENVF
jgi:hypothetical protein